MKKATVVLAFFVLLATMQQPASAGQLQRAVARGATKSAVRSLRLRPTQIKRLDLAKHVRTAPKPLLSGRTVQRYTTQKQALREIKAGVAPNTHMTAIARPGRPLTAAAAKQRFGLLTAPQVRETIRLTKGVPVRHVRATAAGRGVWELTSPQRLPPKVIQKVTPLKKLTR